MNEEYSIESKESNSNKLIVKDFLIIRLMKLLQTPNIPHQKNPNTPSEMMPSDSLDD